MAYSLMSLKRILVLENILIYFHGAQQRHCEETYLMVVFVVLYLFMKILAVKYTARGTLCIVFIKYHFYTISFLYNFIFIQFHAKNFVAYKTYYHKVWACDFLLLSTFLPKVMRFSLSHIYVIFTP